MPVRTMSPGEVDRLRSQDASIELIDVRTPAEFAQAHATGARSIPIAELDPRKLPSDRPIYFLCKGGGRATKAAEKCAAAGFGNAVVVEGGTDAWVRAGLAVTRGSSKMISLERQVRIVAGFLVLVGVILGWTIHPAFYGLSAFIGAGLIFAGVTDWCGMGMLLARMPWNR